MRVFADPDNTTGEIREDNNELNETRYVHARKDVAVSNLTFNQGLPKPGEDVSITAVVENKGSMNTTFTVDLWAVKTETEHQSFESPHHSEFIELEGIDYERAITTYPEADWIGVHFDRIETESGSETRRMYVVDKDGNDVECYNNGVYTDKWVWANGSAIRIILPNEGKGGNGLVWGFSIDRIAHKIILNHTTITLGAGNSTDVTGTLRNVRIGNGSLSYTVYAVVDMDNIVYETDEYPTGNKKWDWNNEMIKTLNMAIPDLTVSGIECEGGEVKAIIENKGYVEAKNVTVRFIRDVDYPFIVKGGSNWHSIWKKDADVMRIHAEYLYVREGEADSYLYIGNELHDKDDKDGFWSPWTKDESIPLDWNEAGFEIDKYEYGVDKPRKGYGSRWERKEELPDEREVEGPHNFRVVNKIYNLTVWVDPEDEIAESNEGNNDYEKLMGPDITIGSIKFYNKNNNYVANDKLIIGEKHTIKVEVKNTGCVAAKDFSVAVYVNESASNATIFYNETRPSDLGSGVKTWVDFLWTPSERGFYDVKVMVDKDNDIPELNENNNIYPSYGDGVDVKVGEPNYRAKSYPLHVLPSQEIHGGMYYDIGNSYYDAVYYFDPDEDYIINFENEVPDGATVELARLYLYLWGVEETWDPGKLPVVEMYFNDNLIPTAVSPYEEYPGATGNNYTYATFCYDVSDYVHPGSDLQARAVFTKTAANMVYAKSGMGLIVVYTKTDAPLMRYYIGEGGDVIMAKNTNPFFTTGFEYADCTRRVEFNGVEYAHLANATLLTVLAPYSIESLCEGEEVGDALYFNNPSKMLNIPSLSDTGHWAYVGSSNLALTAGHADARGWEYVAVKDDLNTAEIQSRGNYFFLANAFLNVTYPPDLVKPDLPPKVIVGESIQVVIKNIGRSDARNFTVSFYVDGVFKGKVPVDEVEGVEGSKNWKELVFPWTAPITKVGQFVELNVSVDSDDEVSELREDNNNASRLVPVVEGSGLPQRPGGGGGTGDGWGEGTGSGEGGTEGIPEGAEGAVGETGGKAITGYLMKGKVASSEAGGGGEGVGTGEEFSILGLLMRLAMLAAAGTLVCVGYLMERRRQNNKLSLEKKV